MAGGTRAHEVRAGFLREEEKSGLAQLIEPRGSMVGPRSCLLHAPIYHNRLQEGLERKIGVGAREKWSCSGVSGSSWWLVFLAAGDEGPAEGEKEEAGGEEGVIEDGDAEVFDDVMEMKDVVVDGAFDEVEKPPPQEHRTDEALGGEDGAIVGDCSPEEDQADEGGGPGECVKHAIPKHVDLQVLDAGFGKFCGEHGVNLEKLVEENAVEKPAEADAKEDAGAD